MAAKLPNRSFVGAYIYEDEADALEAILREAGLTMEDWFAAVVKDAFTCSGTAHARPVRARQAPNL